MILERIVLIVIVVILVFSFLVWAAKRLCNEVKDYLDRAEKDRME